jgi:hypothetical protein
MNNRSNTIKGIYSITESNSKISISLDKPVLQGLARTDAAIISSMRAPREYSTRGETVSYIDDTGAMKERVRNVADG